MNNPTRRQVIQALAAVTIIGVLPKSSLAATTTSVQGLDGILQVVHPSDPAFSSLLETNFPGLASQKRFGKIQSSAIIVTNTGRKPIYGFTVQWSATAPNGYTETYHRTFARRPTVCLKHRRRTARTQFLKHGEVALITPLFLWRAKHYTAAKPKYHLTQKQFGDYTVRYERAHGIIRRVRSAHSTQIAVESVVFHSKIIGAGASTTSKMLRNYQNAEHDEARHLLKVSKTHKVGSPAFLSATTESYNSHQYLASTGKHRPYHLARARFANRVTLAAKYGNHPHVLRTLHRVSRSKRSRYI